jgi:transposase
MVARGMVRLRRIMMEIQTGTRALPLLVKETMCELYERMQKLAAQAREHEHKISSMVRQSEAENRVMAIEGIGPITATAIVASMGDTKLFRNGRALAA